MTNQNRETISGVFKDKRHAKKVIDDLEALGLSDRDVSVVMPDTFHRDNFDIETTSKLPEGTAVGATGGGAVGGILAGLTTAGTLAIPGLNVVAVGPIVGVAAGIGTGGTVGGVAGALIGLGFKEREAKVFEDQVKSGGVLVAAQVPEKLKGKAKDIFKGNEAHDLMVA